MSDFGCIYGSLFRLYTIFARLLKLQINILKNKHMNDQIKQKLELLSQIYTPSYPIEIKALFSGRTKQMSDVMGIIPQKGKQLIVYGDRGVGKTSFANIIKAIYDSPDTQIGKVSCNGNNTFESLMHNALSKFSYNYEEAQQRIGFGGEIEKTDKSLIFSNLYNQDQLSISNLLSIFSIIPNSILILDEFDRLDRAKFDHKIFTDFLKVISDTLPYFTIIIVGVSEDVASLIEGHESIERNLSQIHLQAMSPEEVKQIIVKGEEPLKIKFDEDVIDKIIELSSGYPHFTHSLCYYSCFSAIIAESNVINIEYLKIGIDQTINQVHESLRNSYRLATLANKKNIFQDVLYATSIVETDEYGYFQALDLEPVLSKILGQDVKVNSFVFHLGKFCSPERGDIIKMAGTSHRHRYKFKNPLMRAFVKLKIEANT